MKKNRLWFVSFYLCARSALSAVLQDALSLVCTVLKTVLFAAYTVWQTALYKIPAILTAVTVLIFTVSVTIFTWFYGSCNTLTVFAHSTDESVYLSGSWQKDETGWRFYNQWNYSYPAGQWMEYGGNSYYFMDNSYMATGWKFINSRWYYFNPYEGREQGAMVVGWIHDQVSDTWYYTNQSGVMVTGWHKIDGYWYYFDERPNHILGQMAVSQIVDEAYVDSKGQMNEAK